MKPLLRTLLATMIGLGALCLVGGAAQAGGTPAVSGSGALTHGSAGTVTHGYTTTVNWSGYAVTRGAGAFTTVTSSFIVPQIDCSGGGFPLMSQWVGIDGWANQTVEQDGITGGCAYGKAGYWAWYESYPQPPAPLSELVHAGDAISVSATSSGGQVHYIITDSTAGWYHSAYTADPGTGATAECIVEDTGSGGVNNWKVAPFASFAPATFNSCSANGVPLSYYNPDQIDITGAASAIETHVGPLLANGVFSVTRVLPGQLGGPITGMAGAPGGNGYWLVNAAGQVSAHGGVAGYGDLNGVHLNAPIAHIISSPDGKGYWMVAADGGVFCFGDAGFYGSMGASHLNAPVVSLAPTSDGRGYWLVASDGGIFAFGDAAFYGSMGGSHLNKPVVGIAGDQASGGYWLVATDGGIFAFNAPFYGSTGAITLNSPILAMSPSGDGRGYRFVAADGGVFSYGDALFAGSLAGIGIPAPIAALASDNATGGYWMVDVNGAVYPLGAVFFGSD